jgi:hypothetical protein
VEYKFDQLKVENLNGTLNIGLNPFSAKGQQIEDLFQGLPSMFLYPLENLQFVVLLLKMGLNQYLKYHKQTQTFIKVSSKKCIDT